MLSDKLSPFILAVFEEPLIASSNNALVTRSGDDLFLWLVVRHCQILIHQILLHNWFCFLNFLALGHSDNHLTFIETLLICLVLCLLQEVFVILGFDLQLIYQSDSREVTELGDVDDLNRLEGNAPLFLDAKVFSQL